MVPELSLINDLIKVGAESGGSTSPRLFVHAAPSCRPSGVLPCHAEGLQGRGERVSEGALHPGVVQGAQVLRQLLDVYLRCCPIFYLLKIFLPTLNNFLQLKDSGLCSLQMKIISQLRLS